MQRTVVMMVVVGALALCAGAGWAQLGSPNIPSAMPWQGDDTYIAEGRFFTGSNETWGLFYRGAWGTRGDGEVGYFNWETTGDDPIRGVVRDSDYEAITVDLKWMIRAASPTIAIRGGADLQLGSSRGTNTDTGLSAFSNGPIPVLSLPIEFGIMGDTRVVIEPKYIGFDDPVDVDGGGTIPGWGDVVMVGGSIRTPLSSSTDIVADAAYPISGSNSIDDVTNAVTEELVWSAGVCHRVNSTWMVDVFATNAAGPTPATSSIATPDQSVGGGVAISASW